MRIDDVQPRLVVRGAARAIDFYTAALGAKELTRHALPDGQVVHAELAVGGRTMALKDEDGGDPAPPSLGGTPVILTVHTDDADALGAALERAGATAVFPIDDRDYGFRDGRFRDPFGHLWIVSQPLRTPGP